MAKATVESVRAAAEKLDPSVHFTDDALEAIMGAPKMILSIILKGCIAWAKENNCTELTKREIDIINEKRQKK